MEKIIIITGFTGSGKSGLAVELAKKYDDDKAYMFVNGVLNAVAEALSKK